MGRQAQAVPASGRVWLEGDSTFHRFSAEAKGFAAVFEVPSEAAGEMAAALRDGKVTGLSVEIPVAKLSSKEIGLDEKMHRALKADRAPTISFRMQSYRVVSAGSGFRVEAQGALTIAGVERSAMVAADASEIPGGLRLVGAVPLEMTDFGISPPVLLFGALKVESRVEVKFELTVMSPSASSAAR